MTKYSVNIKRNEKTQIQDYFERVLIYNETWKDLKVDISIDSYQRLHITIREVI